MSIPKKELYRIIDALPEQKVMEALRLLQSLLSQDSDDEFFQNPPIDDEPLTEEDLKAIKEAEEAIANGEVYALKK